MAFELIEKLINEHGSAANRGEIIALLRQQIDSESRKLAEVTAERDALLVENKALSQKLAERVELERFTNYKGVLWSSDGDEPYCPKCKLIMHAFPPPSVGRPMQWSCSQCHLSIGYCKAPSALQESCWLARQCPLKARYMSLVL